MWAAVFRVFSSGLSGLTSGLGRAASSVGSFDKIFNNTIFKSVTAANALSKALGALQAGFHNALQSAKQFSNLSLRLGIKPSEVAALSQFANDAGVSLMVLGKAVMQTEKFGQQAQFSKKFKEVNQILGLTNDELMKLKNDGAEGLAVIAERYQQINDEQQQMMVLQTLYGARGAMQMKQVLERDPREIREGIKSYAASDQVIRSTARMEDAGNKLLNVFKVLGQELMAAFEPLMGVATQFGVVLAKAIMLGVQAAQWFFEFWTARWLEANNAFANSTLGKWLVGKLTNESTASSYAAQSEKANYDYKLYAPYREQAQAEGLKKFEEQLGKIFGRSLSLFGGGNPFQHLKEVDNFTIRHPERTEKDTLFDRLDEESGLRKLAMDRLSIEEQIAANRKEMELASLKNERELMKLKEQDENQYESEKQRLQQRQKERFDTVNKVEAEMRNADLEIARLQSGSSALDAGDLFAAGTSEAWKAAALGYSTTAAGAALTGTALVYTGGALATTGVGGAGLAGSVQGGRYVMHEMADSYALEVNQDPERQAEIWSEHKDEILARRAARIEELRRKKATLGADVAEMKEAGQKEFESFSENTDPSKQSFTQWFEKNKNRPEVVKALKEGKMNIAKLEADFSNLQVAREKREYARQDFADEMAQGGRSMYLHGIEKTEGPLARKQKELEFHMQEMDKQAARLAEMTEKRAEYDQSLIEKRSLATVFNNVMGKMGLEGMKVAMPTIGDKGINYTEEELDQQKKKVLDMSKQAQEMLIAQSETQDGFFTAIGDSMRSVGGGGNVAAGPVNLLAESLEVQKQMRDTLLKIAAGMGMGADEAAQFADESLATLTQ